MVLTYHALFFNFALKFHVVSVHVIELQAHCIATLHTVYLFRLRFLHTVKDHSLAETKQKQQIRADVTAYESRTAKHPVPYSLVSHDEPHDSRLALAAFHLKILNSLHILNEKYSEAFI